MKATLLFHLSMTFLLSIYIYSRVEIIVFPSFETLIKKNLIQFKFPIILFRNYLIHRYHFLNLDGQLSTRFSIQFVSCNFFHSKLIRF